MNFIAENPILFTAIGVFIIMTAMFAIDFYIAKKKNIKLEEEKILKEQEEAEQVEPVEEVKQTPTTSYTDLMEILSGTIDKELYFWLKLTVDMKDVKIIDFAETVDLLGKRIYGSLSAEYISDLSYYHNEVWIMEFIVRHVKIYVTEYIRKNRV